MDWAAWHQHYDDPASPLNDRLRCVQAHLADAFDRTPLLLCGIFGNVSDGDIERTARAAPVLCRGGATVIWTRHRRPPDLTPQVRAWFARLVRAPAAGLPGERLFTFRSSA